MTLFPLATALLLAAAPVFAQSTPATPSPQTFAEQAASSNAFEVESSNLALQSVTVGETAESNQPLIDFARGIINDHEAAGERLQLAARQDGITIPAQIDAQHTEKLDALKTASTGEAFPAAYLEAQIAAHQDAVALFTAFSTQGPQGALKTFATETLPVLQQHQRHAQELAAR